MQAGRPFLHSMLRLRRLLPRSLAACSKFFSTGTPLAALKPVTYRIRTMSASSTVTGPTPGELAAVGNRPIFKVACVQMSVGADKRANLTNAATAVAKAAANGAKIVVLPEMFNCPYSNASFPVYAEEVPAINTAAAAHDAAAFPSAAALSNIALQNKIYLVGGSIPEKEDGKLYNTCLIYSPEGTLLNKHRKVHLFDIDVPGQYFKESDTLTAGNQITTFETEFGATIGVGICYDIRFAEYAMAASKKGAEMLIYPGAFNHITGPVHWELLQRGRALDNQLYVATASPSLDPNFSYKAHGHSSIVGPWGNVIAQCQHDDAIVYGDVNLNWVAEVRSRIALRNQKRGDLYEVVAKM